MSTKTELLKSLAIGELVFAVLYFGARIYAYYRPLVTAQAGTILLWNLDILLALLISGYVAAQVFHRQRIAIGIAAGFLAGLITLLHYFFQFGRAVVLHDWVWIMLWSSLLGGVGGLASWLQAWVLRFSRSAKGRQSSPP